MTGTVHNPSPPCGRVVVVVVVVVAVVVALRVVVADVAGAIVVTGIVVVGAVDPVVVAGPAVLRVVAGGAAPVDGEGAALPPTAGAMGPPAADNTKGWMLGAAAASTGGGPSTVLIRIGSGCVRLAVVNRPLRSPSAAAIRSLIATARISPATSARTTTAANALGNCEAPWPGCS